MVRTAQAKLTGFAREADDLVDLGQRFMPALQSQIRAEAAAIIVGPLGCPPSNVIGNIDHIDPDIYFSRFVTDDPISRFIPLKREPVFAARQSIHPQVLEGRVFSEFYEPRGLFDVMASRLDEDDIYSPEQAVMVCFRSRSEGAFDRSDVHLIQSLIPALREAGAAKHPPWTHLDADSLLDSVTQYLGDRALLVFGCDGKLVWLSPMAKDVLGARYRPTARTAARIRELATHRRPTPIAATVCMGTERVLLSVVRRGNNTLVIGELSATEALTPAEVRVLNALQQGYSNARIAAELHISVATVKTHVHRIFGKLGVTSRLEAALFARGRTPR